MKKFYMTGWVQEKYAGKPLEAKPTKNGKAIRFTIKTSEKRGDAWFAEYFDCKMFLEDNDPRLDAIMAGAKVFASGDIEQEKWQGKDGKDHSRMALKVTDLFVEAQAGSAPMPVQATIMDEDIPF